MRTNLILKSDELAIVATSVLRGQGLTRYSGAQGTFNSRRIYRRDFRDLECCVLSTLGGAQIWGRLGLLRVKGALQLLMNRYG